MKYDYYKVLLYFFFENLWNHHNIKMANLVFDENIILSYESYKIKGIKAFLIFKAILKQKKIPTQQKIQFMMLQGELALVRTCCSVNNAISYTMVIKFNRLKIREIVLIKNDKHLSKIDSIKKGLQNDGTKE